MDFELNALPDDFNLNALGDTSRGTGTSFYLAAYLTDPSGNRLTDPSGNYLIGYYQSTIYPQKLSANKDSFELNAE